MKISRVLLIFAASSATGCGDNASREANPVTVMSNSVAAPIAPAKPPHGYDLKEGTAYAYIAGVSDDERKAGKAAGDVLMFKYLGNRDGVHAIATLDHRGGVLDKSTCAEPCVIIKNDDGTRTAYNPDSVIGSVFQDAIAGNLVDSSKASANASIRVADAVATIPKSFRGEWDSDPAACGTGLGDSRLMIAASKLSFYESDAQLKSIKVENPGAITLHTSSSGEGQTWESDMTLVLSRSGRELTITSGGNSFTRSRCPKR